MRYQTSDAYLLGDNLTREECTRLGITRRQGWRYFKGDRRVEVRAVFSSERRVPREGERYLSGAVPSAYLAPAGMTSPYHIANLIAVVLVKYWEVV